VPCAFFGEGERKDLRWVDFFFFDHVGDLRGDGRGLACAVRMSWGRGCGFDGGEMARF